MKLKNTLLTFALLSLGAVGNASEDKCNKWLDQVIVKFKTVNSLHQPQLNAQWWDTFSKQSGLPIKSVKPLPSGAYLVVLDSKKLKQLSVIQKQSKDDYVNRSILNLKHNLNIKYADRDITHCVIKPPTIRTPQIPLSKLLGVPVISHASQWDEFSYPGVFLESSPGAQDGAWATTQGNASPPIVLSNFEPINYNPDLEPNLLTGWSFSKHSTNTRDPSDDHGTHTAGTIAAAGLTPTEIAGMGPLLKILPIEVETLSEVEEGLYWAMGRNVLGAPPNEYPVKVINMSFVYKRIVGCPESLQEAIDAYASQGTIIVSAGNDDEPASNNPPRACDNVMVIAATQRDGYRAIYSNYGPRVTLAAPGGEVEENTCDENGILSTVSVGTGCNGSDFEFYQGTSMAAPHVTGIAGLLLAINPNFTPQQIQSMLLESVEPFATTVDPNRSCKGIKSCGIGIINANNAVALANTGHVIIAAPSPTDLELQTSFDPFNRCRNDMYAPTAQLIQSPLPNSNWIVNKSTRACQLLSLYEVPVLQVKGRKLQATYGKTVFTLSVPQGLTCSIENAHGFSCA